MALSNWVDLAVGLGLGAGIGWLFWHGQVGDSTPPQAEEVPNSNEEVSGIDLIRSIQEELKQTVSSLNLAETHLIVKFLSQQAILIHPLLKHIPMNLKILFMRVLTQPPNQNLK